MLQALRSGRRAALATVVRVAGSTPQRAGARLLLLDDGTLVGTVGGGAIERTVVQALREALDGAGGKDARLLSYELGYDLGMCCGGRMEVFVEAIAASPRLIMLGAGHVAKPTAALARSVGFHVHVIDEREELATSERFPDCSIVLADPETQLRRMTLSEHDWVLILTHDHRLDQALLALALASTPRYIGMIGSKRKVFRSLRRTAATANTLDLSRVYAPVGLDIGALGPEEIAVSIVAELIALRRERNAPHMRAVADPRLTRSLGVEQPAHAEPPRGLPELERQVARDLELLHYPRRQWLQPRSSAAGGHAHDVIIVGAGQSGLAAAFGLMREHVTNLLLVDQNPLDRAGPWLNFARMRTLRTPKYLTGPDLGVASLTPRNWYEAQHGPGSWEQLSFLPKESWAGYLAWYRRTLGLPVQPDTQVGALRWDAADQLFLVPCTRGAQTETLRARRVVLATGIEGSGQWDIPAQIRESLPAQRYAHTHDPIDFAALRGKRIAVLGAGASAFDNAASALEAGASEVRLYFRRPRLVDVNAYRWAEFVGFLRHFGELSDADKWRFVGQIRRMGQLPPSDTFQRARQHANFYLHPNSHWRRLKLQGDVVSIHSDGEQRECDFVIVGTGFITDLGLRPELAELSPLIARWSDRYVPPASERDEDMLRHPYLGSHFEFTERTPGSAPYLKYLYNYTFGCLLSLGFGGASISGMKYSIPRLVAGITGSFFVQDSEHYFNTLREFDEKEL